jgi:hypothetical protein
LQIRKSYHFCLSFIPTFYSHIWELSEHYAPIHFGAGDITAVKTETNEGTSIKCIEMRGSDVVEYKDDGLVGCCTAQSRTAIALMKDAENTSESSADFYCTTQKPSILITYFDLSGKSVKYKRVHIHCTS